MIDQTNQLQIIITKDPLNKIIDEQNDKKYYGYIQIYRSSFTVSDVLCRSEIFKNDRNLAWQIMDTECSLYTESEVKIDNITHLASLYMRIIETLNGLQDKRQEYFSSKMQKLMREPFITRCFNNQVDNHKDVLENRRKEIELRVEQQSEKQSHKKVLEQAIKAQEIKEQSVREKIKIIQKQSNQQLEQRIRRRNYMRQNRSNISPKSSRERSWQFSDKTILSGGKRVEVNDNVSQFQLKIDEDNQFLRSLKRQVARQEQQESLQRALFKDKQLQK